MNVTSDQSDAEPATVRLYLEMRQRVIDGRLRGGQLIQTPSVLAFFECGMSSARDAMRRLRQEGYFLQDARGRNFVRTWSSNELADAWSIGATMWGYAALRFTERTEERYKIHLNALLTEAINARPTEPGEIQFTVSSILATLHMIAARSKISNVGTMLDLHVPLGLRRICLQILTSGDLQRLSNQLLNAIGYALAGQAQLAGQGIEMAVRSILPPATAHFSWLSSLPTTSEAVFDDSYNDVPQSPWKDFQPYYGIGKPEIVDVEKWILQRARHAEPAIHTNALSA